MCEWFDDLEDRWADLSYGEFLLICIATTALFVMLVLLAIMVWIEISKFVVLGVIGYFLATYALYLKVVRRGHE